MRTLRDQIRGQLADLQMPGSLESLDAVLSRVDSGLGAAEAISAVLEAQIQLRNNRRLQAAMRSSRLPAVKTLSDFDFSYSPRSSVSRSRASRPKHSDLWKALHQLPDDEPAPGLSRRSRTNRKKERQT